MADNRVITAQQRAMLFGANTRQHFQMLGSKEIIGGAQTITFNIPKVRLLQSVRLLVECTYNIKGSSSLAKPENETLLPYKLLRRVSIDFNNGFSPIVISGKNMALLNMLRLDPHIIEYADNYKTLSTVETFTASSSGTDNKISFMLELPLTLNERDPVGLVLAQSQETNITIQCDIANDSVLCEHDSSATGIIKNLKITPELTTFSVPKMQEAFPDMSVLRVVSENNDILQSGGSNTIKMQTCMIYRKLMLYFTDENGNPLSDEEITSNIEIVLNSADIPYSINPKMLRYMNTSQLGYQLPKGVYVFDFSNQGIPSYGGSRDYLDTERVTQFEVRFTPSKSGILTVISEKLSRLIG